MPGRPEPITPCFGSTFAPKAGPTSRYFRPAAANYPLSLVRHIGMVLTADRRNCLRERNCSRSGRPRRLPAPRQRTPGAGRTGSGPAPSSAGPPPRAAARRGTRRAAPAGRGPGQPAGPVMPAGKGHAPCRLSHLTQDPPVPIDVDTGYTAPPPRGFNGMCKFFSPERIMVTAPDQWRGPGVADRHGRRVPGDATMPCGPRSL